jgi:SPP1 family predicted phage head-tail adaptor
MRAGEMRHRITLQKPTHTRNDFNESVTTYNDFVTVWGTIEWQSGRRFVEAKQLNAEVQGVVRIRYRSRVLPEWRIKFDNRYLEILSISNIYERGQELQINVKESQD